MIPSLEIIYGYALGEKTKRKKDINNGRNENLASFYIETYQNKLLVNRLKSNLPRNFTIVASIFLSFKLPSAGCMVTYMKWKFCVYKYIILFKLN